MTASDRDRLERLLHRLKRHDDTHCNRAFCGVTRVAHRLYYPKYNFQTALKKGGATAARASRETTVRTRRKAGMSHGRCVDREIARATKAYNRFVRSIATTKRSCATLPCFRRFARDGQGTISDTARRLIAHLDGLELVPIDAQVRVVDRANRVRTCVDLVCARKRRVDSLVLVEVKCGFEGYVSLASGRMQFELRDVPDSPRNQHHLQLALTRELYARTYQDQPEAIVVWITDTTAHHERVEPWAVRHAPDVLRRIRRSRSGASG
ncbi:hypothetical protein CYMTET_3904 [Cymbomonas tetramitiformis]|uniref:Uncharacterized protein n=1 Tax=Cymbomonas tetramitiformis TaxID=36881 RepID=A0AAE0GUI8_9CHLO|nr:hypothetical protein CYMTET_7887 [Cymbomonas tetramitiformis]KAK3288686.1 hypothetical protein CYMTET_3904 [Cymbomonas tetramitiformis]|eukprot:gene26204-32106_t